MLFKLLSKLLYVPASVTIKSLRVCNTDVPFWLGVPGTNNEYFPVNKQRVLPCAALRNASMMETLNLYFCRRISGFRRLLYEDQLAVRSKAQLILTGIKFTFSWSIVCFICYSVSQC